MNSLYIAGCLPRFGRLAATPSQQRVITSRSGAGQPPGISSRIPCITKVGTMAGFAASLNGALRVAISHTVIL